MGVLIPVLNRIGFWKQELPWDTLNIMPKSPNLKFVPFEDHLPDSLL